MLNIQALDLALVVSEKKIFPFYKPMVDIDTWSIWTPVAKLAGFMKGTTKHCYMQNIKTLKALWFQRRIFLVSPIVSPWELVCVAMETTIFFYNLLKNQMHSILQPNDGLHKI